MNESQPSRPGDQESIDPMVDCVFKAILGSPEHADVTKHFLNAVLELKGDDHIRDIHIENPFSPKNYVTEKQVVVDVQIRDHKGDHYLAEMQMVAPPSVKGRMMFHWAKIMSKMLQEGQDYANLPRVISIWIFATRLFKHSRKPHLRFGIRCQDNQFNLTDYPIIHALQLKNLGEGLTLDGGSQPSDKHAWMSFFSKADKIQIGQLAEAFQAPIFEEVAEIMHTFTEKGNNAQLYHMQMRSLADKRTWENAIETERERAIIESMRADKEALGRALERERADKEAGRADKEAQARALETMRADKESGRANKEAQARALERARGDRLRQLLRQHGIDPSGADD